MSSSEAQTTTQNEGQTTTQTEVQNTSESIMSKPATRRYWPVPPIMPLPFEYINVNKDVNLRKDVTTFFHGKILKWINNNDPLFKRYHHKKSFLNTIDGQMHVYHLLKKFVRKSGINWYDLRDNYELIKKYLSMKL